MASITTNESEKRPRRTSAKKPPSYAEYDSFLFSDEDGSESNEELCEEDIIGSEDEAEYDASIDPETFDKKRGDLNWVGRRICKVFGSQGDFEGIVFATDDDAQRNGYRLFRVHYFEDPDDGESMWAEELMQ